MGVMAIIPARKGSNRVKDKNKRDFNGKPLIQWTIEAALECDFIDPIIVSSDDLDILELAFSYFDTKRIQPHRRPKFLCKNSVPLKNVCRQIFSVYGGYEEFVLLQPTSPQRTAEDIKKAYELFKGHDFLISTTKGKDNGAINFARTEPFINEWTWEGNDTVKFDLPVIDIDTEEDFKRAEDDSRNRR